MKNFISLILTLTIAFDAMATPTNYETSNPIDHGSAVDQLVQVTPQSATFDLGDQNDYRLHFCGDQNDRHIGNPPSIGHRIYQSANSQFESEAYCKTFQSCKIDRPKSGQYFSGGMCDRLVDKYYKTATKNDHQIARNDHSQKYNGYRPRTLHTTFIKASYMDWRSGAGSTSWRHSNSTLKTKMALI